MQQKKRDASWVKPLNENISHIVVDLLLVSMRIVLICVDIGQLLNEELSCFDYIAIAVSSCSKKTACTLPIRKFTKLYRKGQCRLKFAE